MITDDKPGMIAVHCRRSYIVPYGYRLPHLRSMQCFIGFPFSVGSSACLDPELRCVQAATVPTCTTDRKHSLSLERKSVHLLNKQWLDKRVRKIETPAQQTVIGKKEINSPRKKSLSQERRCCCSPLRKFCRFERSCCMDLILPSQSIKTTPHHWC